MYHQHHKVELGPQLMNLEAKTLKSANNHNSNWYDEILDVVGLLKLLLLGEKLCKSRLSFDLIKL